ncbi:MAG: chemotaxis protein CheC [Lachnospiraceae bacterium]|jgi:chemotaxis protein CheC|uniref:chemotaxis protein CheC n=1 Tax=Candidatus Merdisoma sp. JLR.KK006 TaxID=3112626 RepID=UPI002FF1A5EB|nr:chemotaxis protein CheC [Lachnospiraceae bacterium]
MSIKRFEDMNAVALDVFREIGSIGVGNAATALSEVLGVRVRMKLPKVSIEGYDEAISSMGHPEDMVAAVLVEMGGDIKGIMLYMLKLDFINAILARLVGKYIEDFSQIDELSASALEETGNIIISSYVNAITKLAGLEVPLSVPSVSVNMLGGILSVPMAMFGEVSDKLMMIQGEFLIGDTQLEGDLLLLPDIESLNFLLKKLGVADV